MRSWPLMLILLAACGGDTTTFVGFPPIDAAQSLVVAIDDGGRLEGATALSADNPNARAQLPVDRDDDASIVAMMFDAPLDELGLPPGRLERVPAGQPLPSPRATYRRSIGTEAEWAPSEVSTALLGTFLVERATPSPCVSFTSVSFELETDANPWFVLTLDPSSALIVTTDRRWYVVRPDGVESAVPWIDASVVGGEIDERGVAWFFTHSGAVWRGDATDPTSFVPFGDAGVATTFRWGTVTSSSTIALLATSGEVVEVGETGSTVLETLPPIEDGGITSTADGTLLIATAESAALVRIEKGRRPFVEPVSDAESFASIAHRPDVGTALGGRVGRIFVNAEGFWRDLGSLGRAVWTIVPYRNGFLFGGDDGLMGEFVPSHGFCILARATTEIRRMAPVGDDVVLGHFGGEGEPTLVSWLTANAP